MEQFLSYPVETSSGPAAATDRFVVVASSWFDGGRPIPTLRTDPMSWDDAQHLVAQIAAGRSTNFLIGPIELVAELEPGRLMVCRQSGIFRGEEIYNVRVARVLHSAH